MACSYILSYSFLSFQYHIFDPFGYIELAKSSYLKNAGVTALGGPALVAHLLVSCNTMFSVGPDAVSMVTTICLWVLRRDLACHQQGMMPHRE
jgi:predicted small secreted protein